MLTYEVLAVGAFAHHHSQSPRNNAEIKVIIKHSDRYIVNSNFFTSNSRRRLNVIS